MSYVINPTGRSRRRRGGCGCGYSQSGCGCHHHHNNDRCGYTLAQSTQVLPVVYTTGDCGCPDGCPAPYLRNVIYTGPCPPGPDCPCQPPLPPPPPDPPCYRPVPSVNSYAYFAQTGALSVTESNGVVQLDSVADVSADSFEVYEGVVTINRPGTYLATFTMSLPSSSCVNTQVSMLLDSDTLPGSVATVNKSSGSPGSIMSQSVFTVTQPGNEFAVISSRPFCITADSSDDTLATLTISQIGGGLIPAPYVV